MTDFLIQIIPQQKLIEIAVAAVCGLIGVIVRAAEKHFQAKAETTYLAIMVDAAGSAAIAGLNAADAPGLTPKQRFDAAAQAAWEDVISRKPQVIGAFQGQAQAILHKYVHDALAAKTPSGNQTVNLPTPGAA